MASGRAAGAPDAARDLRLPRAVPADAAARGARGGRHQDDPVLRPAGGRRAAPGSTRRCCCAASAGSTAGRRRRGAGGGLRGRRPGRGPGSAARRWTAPGLPLDLPRRAARARRPRWALRCAVRCAVGSRRGRRRRDRPAARAVPGWPARRDRRRSACTTGCSSPPTTRPQARETIDLGGRLVTPPLVEPHIHLDAVLTVGQPRPTSAARCSRASRSGPSGCRP